MWCHVPTSEPLSAVPLSVHRSESSTVPFRRTKAEKRSRCSPLPLTGGEGRGGAASRRRSGGVPASPKNVADPSVKHDRLPLMLWLCS